MLKFIRSAVVVCSLVALSGHAKGAADDTTTPSTGGEDENLKTPRRALAAREIELKEAQKDLNSVADKLRAKFDQSDEWKDAQAALKKAQADRDAAVAPVLTKLQDRPDYAAALDAKTKAAAEVDRLRAAGSSGPEVAAAAKASTEASAAVKKMESDAINADPTAKAAAAKALEAGTKSAAIEKKFNDSIKLSPEFEKATKRVEEARQRVDRATIAVRQMERHEAARKNGKRRK